MFKTLGSFILLFATFLSMVPVDGHFEIGLLKLGGEIEASCEKKQDERYAVDSAGDDGAFFGSLGGRFRLLACVQIILSGGAVGAESTCRGRWLMADESGVFLI